MKQISGALHVSLFTISCTHQMKNVWTFTYIHVDSHVLDFIVSLCITACVTWWCYYGLLWIFFPFLSLSHLPLYMFIHIMFSSILFSSINIQIFLASMLSCIAWHYLLSFPKSIPNHFLHVVDHVRDSVWVLKDGYLLFLVSHFWTIHVEMLLFCFARSLTRTSELQLINNFGVRIMLVDSWNDWIFSSKRRRAEMIVLWATFRPQAFYCHITWGYEYFYSSE